MPNITHRGQSIHYTVDGGGPLLILQHGLFSSAAHWHEMGYIDVFKQHFTVACVDSLAHGKSDAPLDTGLYGQHQRAGDVVAVIDDLGFERAHVLGYSMGGWIAVGVAKYYPQRLASLVVAGWDCIRGAQTVADAIGLAKLDFDTLFATLQEVAPDMAKQATAENLPAFRACFEALMDLDGAETALDQLNVPVMLWDGQDDPYHGPMQAFAQSKGYEFLSTPGDHLGAMLNHGPQTAKSISDYLLHTAA